MLVSEPLSPFDPVHPPEAVQEETFVDDQVKVVVPPGATPRGDAVSDTDGEVEAVTLTVTLATAPPPGPLQFSVNVVLVAIAPLVALPLTARLPVQPPDAVQVSALLVDQDNAVVPPELTVVGEAEKLIVGGLEPPGPCGAALSDPPPPPHAARAIDATINVADLTAGIVFKGA